jgi:hypothetical protein
MFFIPFFGAAVSGRPRGVAAWKEALVSLLGPLPGVVLGLVGLFVFGRHPTALSISVVQVLIFLNAFNLLPFGFLDGGRFLGRVLLSRHRVLEVGFLGLGSLALALFALKAGLYIVAGFSLFSLLVLRARWAVLKAAVALRAQNPSIDSDPDTIGEGDARAVFAAARALVPERGRDQPGPIANVMEQIIDATKPAPGALATLGLLALYGFGLVCGALGVVVVAGEMGSAQWETFVQPDWRAEFPRRPNPFLADPVTGGVAQTWRTAIEGTERFTITVVQGTTAADAARWATEAPERLAKVMGMPLLGSHPIAQPNLAGHEYELGIDGRIARARVFLKDARAYELVTSAPAWGGNQQRFLDSFALVAP